MRKEKLVAPKEVRSNCFAVSALEDLFLEKNSEFKNRPEIDLKLNIPSNSRDLELGIELSLLKRIISNLINNAVQAIDGPGNVSITLHRFPTQTKIRIQDNGRGISSKILPDLGKMGATFYKSSGLGMGLYHCKNSLERIGGTFSIKSSLGEGSEVLLTIPNKMPSATDVQVS